MGLQCKGLRDKQKTDKLPCPFLFSKLSTIIDTGYPAVLIQVRKGTIKDKYAHATEAQMGAAG